MSLHAAEPRSFQLTSSGTCSQCTENGRPLKTLVKGSAILHNPVAEHSPTNREAPESPAELDETTFLQRRLKLIQRAPDKDI